MFMRLKLRVWPIKSVDLGGSSLSSITGVFCCLALILRRKESRLSEFRRAVINGLTFWPTLEFSEKNGETN